MITSTSPSANNWIRFVRKYGPIPANDSAFEEHTGRAARRAGVTPIAFTHPRFSEVLQCFAGRELVSVILTGTAGDGKTHLCSKVWEYLEGDGATWSSNNPYIHLTLTSGATLHVIRDLSAWVPQQGAEWETEGRMLLELFSNSLFENNTSDYFLIAANDGQLIETWRRLPDSPTVSRARSLFEQLLVEDQEEQPGISIRFFNLSRGSSAELFDCALEAFLSHPGWKLCFEGEAGSSLAYGQQSPIRRNFELLQTPLLQQRLRDLLELCDYNDLHIPIREILALLVNAVLGYAGKNCKDQLMVPTDIPRIITDGSVGEASIYNNLIGGNLRESRRESIGVFNYLDRFRLGHETTNRIDSILIFGEADEALHPYYQQYLGNDQFYGADARYQQAQSDYVESADEDISNSQFLEMLVTQRRALFFKISSSESQDLHLWELTVFRFAGEFLERVIRIVHPTINGRVDRHIVSRLVRGLNRVIVGMLINDDRKLCLGTSLQSTGAKVSRIYEDSISVVPSKGERVEIVWYGNKPALQVTLAENISESFPLNLVRYEFLSRVAEGALPSSFSKECYEDILSFKSRLLKALKKRRQTEQIAGDEFVLRFQRLRLDENGNPEHRTIQLNFSRP
ncbi:hypothetical protein [Spirosoma radiotolerans]|uniref:Uncharacterized protein n=1 Tax=Spirosoma radiotolerans TaxID=1379870 RepID=A0A0E4A1N8_9BACT|nr:hypothetical protein [Spirosoma radiotolerans]AKD58687.1 hypothetical protein SD10_20725 [Spirosoma radiotolerans]